MASMNYPRQWKGVYSEVISSHRSSLLCLRAKNQVRTAAWMYFHRGRTHAFSLVHSIIVALLEHLLAMIHLGTIHLGTISRMNLRRREMKEDGFIAVGMKTSKMRHSRSAPNKPKRKMMHCHGNRRGLDMT